MEKKESDLPNRHNCDYRDICPVRQFDHNYCEDQTLPDCPQYKLMELVDEEKRQTGINREHYMTLQELDIVKYQLELSDDLGRLISREVAFEEWVRQGRAEEFRNYYMENHLNDL